MILLRMTAKIGIYKSFRKNKKAEVKPRLFYEVKQAFNIKDFPQYFFLHFSFY